MPGYTPPDSTMVSSRPMGGNVGPVGSPDEKDLLGAILGGDLNSAAEMLLGLLPGERS